MIDEMEHSGGQTITTRFTNQGHEQQTYTVKNNKIGNIIARYYTHTVMITRILVSRRHTNALKFDVGNSINAVDI